MANPNEWVAMRLLEPYDASNKLHLEGEAILGLSAYFGDVITADIVYAHSPFGPMALPENHYEHGPFGPVSPSTGGTQADTAYYHSPYGPTILVPDIKYHGPFGPKIG